MGNPTSYDWQAIGLAVCSGIVLGVGLGFKPPRGRVYWVALMGLLGGTLGLASGFYAQHTGLHGIVQTVLGWNGWIALFLTFALLVLVAFGIAALTPILHDAAVTPGIVAALIIAPVLFALNPMPGTADGDVLRFLRAIATPTLQLMAGKFGAV